MSPEGNGADCHRTWEALLLGCIPIVKKTYMGSGLYDGLPVVYVNEWSEITPDRLAAEWSKYVNAPKGTYQFEKLFADYWVDRIKAENFEGVVVKGRKGRRHTAELGRAPGLAPEAVKTSWWPLH